MTPAIRQLFRAYVRRRSPWGPPWWIYGVSYGVLNLIRQVVILLAGRELSTPIRVASWVATALVVVGVVNTVAVVLRHRTSGRDTEMVHAHEMAQSDIGPKEEAA